MHEPRREADDDPGLPLDPDIEVDDADDADDESSESAEAADDAENTGNVVNTGTPRNTGNRGNPANHEAQADGAGRPHGTAARSERSSAQPPRPVHRRWDFVALVALGGALGTAAREAVALALPAADAGSVGVLVPVLLVNVTGAFALGLLLEALLRRGPDHGRRRSLRLLVGTGFLGGYTTYSSLAVGAARTIDAAAPLLGLLYATLSVVAGVCAAFAGIAAAAALHRWQQPTREART